MKIFLGSTGVFLISVLTAAPVLIWFSMQSLPMRFGSFELVMTSLGQLTALAGMALFSINLVLSGRFKFLEKYFNGLNRMYIIHHVVGGLSFVLLLGHPIFLVIRFIPTSVKFAFSFLFGFSDWAVTLGEISLLVMIALLVITFYARWRYENWKLSHQWLGLAFFIGGLHMFFIPSDVSASILLRVYMLGLAGVGLGVFLYKTVLRLNRRTEYDYIVEGVDRVSENVVSVNLSPASKKMEFIPGQFVFVRFEDGGVPRESHPFSITTNPSSGALSLGIKVLGDFTAMLYFLRKGTRARVEGPFGAFSYSRFLNRKQVWIAGGIGITPFLSMARDIASSQGKDYDVDLFYSVKDKDEAIFLEELVSIAVKKPNFRIFPFYSNERGLISADFISKHSTDFAKREIFLCGPPMFMKALRKQFREKKIPNRNIHSEEFQLQ